MLKYKLYKKHEYACLIIGDEILGGHVIESNMLYITKSLSQKGYVLRETRFVSDDVDQIAESLSDLRKNYAFVISTGGIGPTHDDKTFIAVAKSFNVKTELHPEMIHYFLRRKSQRKQSQMDAIRQMSILPKNAIPIFLDENFPLLKIENCFIMPGLPSICIKTLNKLLQILPAQKSRYQAVYYLRAYENEYFTWLAKLSEKYAESINLGSYPIDNKNPDDEIITKISLIASNEAAALACMEEIDKFFQAQRSIIKKTDLYSL